MSFKILNLDLLPKWQAGTRLPILKNRLFRSRYLRLVELLPPTASWHSVCNPQFRQSFEDSNSNSAKEFEPVIQR